MNRAIAALITLLVPVAGSAVQFPGERAPDRYETTQHGRELRDDRRDLRRMERLLARFDDAVARRSRYALAAVEIDVLRTLDRDITEARLELMTSGRDATGDRRYVHCDDRYVHHDRRHMQHDRRDLVRLEAIRSEFGALLGRVDRRSVKSKRSMVGELVQIAQLREDRTDRREAWNHAG